MDFTIAKDVGRLISREPSELMKRVMDFSSMPRSTLTQKMACAIDGLQRLSHGQVARDFTGQNHQKGRAAVMPLGLVPWF